MKTLKIVLDVASIILNISTIVFILATWKKAPEAIESEES